jgi:hypothetical protein
MSSAQQQNCHLLDSKIKKKKNKLGRFGLKNKNKNKNKKNKKVYDLFIGYL